MNITRVTLVCLCAFLCAQADDVLAQQKKQPPIKVGARLSDYKPPTRKQCTSLVPEQHATIAAALSAASNGDRICVGAGDWFEEDLVIAKNVTLSGIGFRDSARSRIANSCVQPQITCQGIYGLFVLAPNVTIEGFELYGPMTPFNGSNGVPVLIWSDVLNPNIVLRSNWLRPDSGSRAIHSDARDGLITLSNNIITANEYAYATVELGAALVTDNTFDGILAEGTWALSLRRPSSTVVRNNFTAVGNNIKDVDVCQTGSSSVTQFNIHMNNLAGGVVTSAGCGAFFNAENNWWGDLDPSDNVFTNVSPITDTIDFTPWATAPFPTR
jgi:hypothetical protein